LNAAEKLMEMLHLEADSAVVIHDPSNMFYLTEGYTGEGLVYVSRKRRAVITDFRYTEQAEKQAAGFQVLMQDAQKDHDRVLAEVLREDGVTAVRFESNFISVDTFEKMRTAAGEEVSFIPLEEAVQKLRQIKTPKEVETMRRAAAITSEAFEAILPKIREGMTEKELQIELDFTMLRLGADGNAFNTIIASGENGSLPHAIPGSRKIRRGDMITMDFGAKVDGYCSDMTRTVAFGEPSEEMRRVYETVYQAQKMCEEALSAGKVCSEIDRMARDYIDSQGYQGRFGHGLGHAVGIDIHEEPRLSQKCHDVLRAGIVITVEPGVYIPGLGGVRIENTCLVKEDGADALTTPKRELIIL